MNTELAKPTSYASYVLCGLALCALVVGGVMYWVSGAGRVTSVSVTRHSLMPENMLEKPDYYVLLTRHDGESHRSESYHDTPMGNGLQFTFAESFGLDDVAEAKLLDEDLLSDDLVDRVSVNGEVLITGQVARFNFNTETPWLKIVGGIVALSGGVYLGIIAIIFVRRNAV